MKIKSLNSRMGLKNLLKKILNSQKVVSRILFLGVFMSASSAFAAGIENTVTAKGTAPGGTVDAIQATDDVTVDVEDAVPDYTLAVSSSDSGVGTGDTVTYTYTFENTGNVTLSAISLADAHDGTGTDPTPALAATPLTDEVPTLDSTDDGLDAAWDSLAPGDTVTWTGTYAVLQTDLNNNGDGDGDLDNTVTVTVTAAAGTLPVDNTATAEVTLEAQNASLAVAKSASDTTNVEVGDVITYTYVVTNDGNVPITGVSLVDDVTAGSGPDPVPAIDDASLEDNGTTGDSSDTATDEVYDTLGVGDKITYTGTYTVTQSDVDTLQ